MLESNRKMPKPWLERVDTATRIRFRGQRSTMRINGTLDASRVGRSEGLFGSLTPSRRYLPGDGLIHPYHSEAHMWRVRGARSRAKPPPGTPRPRALERLFDAVLRRRLNATGQRSVGRRGRRIAVRGLEGWRARRKRGGAGGGEADGVGAYTCPYTSQDTLAAHAHAEGNNVYMMTVGARRISESVLVEVGAGLPLPLGASTSTYDHARAAGTIARWTGRCSRCPPPVATLLMGALSRTARSRRSPDDPESDVHTQIKRRLRAEGRAHFISRARATSYGLIIPFISKAGH
ncbi:hypothetical protein DFH06DRAFT_1129710 [Mycena polygramma]|nr:hypothetical protein DFH06DRAFT_1129710 [Mycena polygramma]